QRRYRELPCGAQRDSANAVIWWLAQPLHTRTENDRRAEHHARLTLARLQEGSRNPYGMRWGSDMRELLVRYGWPRTYTRGYPRTGEPSSPVAGHEPSPSFHFLPHERALSDPATASEHDWEFLAPAARERYAPGWAGRLVRLDAQIATFRRSDSAMVVAVWSSPSGMDGRVWQAGLAASSAPATARIAAPATASPAAPVAATHVVARDSLLFSGTRGVLAVRVPLDTLLVSLELVEQPRHSSA